MRGFVLRKVQASCAHAGHSTGMGLGAASRILQDETAPGAESVFLKAGIGDLLFLIFPNAPVMGGLESHEPARYLHNDGRPKRPTSGGFAAPATDKLALHQASPVAL